MLNKKTYHVELLTPKQDSEKLEEDVEKFAEKFNQLMNAGFTVCITDNPMGNVSFQATDIINEIGLEYDPDRLHIHLNTFHTKDDLHKILDTAAKMKVRHLLVISGDGGPRLPKLQPSSIGLDCNTVTSVELLGYISKTYKGAFSLGVAYNQFEPVDHETEKMRHKIEAGAEFICTQPVLANDPKLEPLAQFKLPVYVGCWMSKKIELVSECVGYDLPKDFVYDPMKNLSDLESKYPDKTMYLSLLGYKTQLPVLEAKTKQA